MTVYMMGISYATFRDHVTNPMCKYYAATRRFLV